MKLESPFYPKGGRMKLIAMIDSAVLSFFTKISHKFYRLTGRTNFFLAKLALCIMTASVMVAILNSWFPLLSRKTSAADTALAAFLSLFFLVDMYNCDRSDNAIFSSGRTRFFNPYFYSPLWRILVGSLAVAITIKKVTVFINSSKGNIILDLLDYMFFPSATSFFYLMSVDPPTPGKSKIREWVESFSAGFRKLVPVKAKN